MISDMATADASRGAVYAHNLGVNPKTTLRVCREVAIWAGRQNNPPDIAERMAEVRRRLLAAAR